MVAPVRLGTAYHSLNGAFQFVELVKERDTTGLKMTTLDVALKFTNLPLSGTIDCLMSRFMSNGAVSRIHQLLIL